MILLPIQQNRPGPRLQAALALSGVSRDPFRFPVEPTREGTAELRETTADFVEAFAEVFGGEVENFGADPLSWVYSPSKSDTDQREFHFQIDDPGSVVELLCLMLPGLLLRDYPTRLVLDGCTHAPGAYLPEQVESALVPLVEAVGGRLEVELVSYGFPPRGGGRVTADIRPAGRLQRLDLRDRGYVRDIEIDVILAHLQRHIGEREIDAFVDDMRADVSLTARLTELHAAPSQGNVMLVDIAGSECAEMIGVLGRRGVRAEEVGRRCLSEFSTYLKGRGQLHQTTPWALLLMVAAGEGELWTTGLGEMGEAICEYAPEFLGGDVGIQDEGSPTTRLKI